MAWFQPSGLAFSTSLTSRRSAIGLIVGGGIGSPRGWPLEGGGRPRPTRPYEEEKKRRPGTRPGLLSTTLLAELPASDSRSQRKGMSVALERAPLRRSRRANEAVGSTTRLIQLGLTSFATRAVNSGAGGRPRRPATSLGASIDSAAMAPRYVAVCGQGAPDPEHERNA